MGGRRRGDARRERLHPVHPTVLVSLLLSLFSGRSKCEFFCCGVLYCCLFFLFLFFRVVGVSCFVMVFYTGVSSFCLCFFFQIVAGVRRVVVELSTGVSTFCLSLQEIAGKSCFVWCYVLLVFSFVSVF